MYAEFETLIVTVKLPDSVGVPEILPVVSPRFRPPGSLPLVMRHLKGAVPETVISRV